MAIYHNGKKIISLYHGENKIKSVYHNGDKIYSSLLPFGTSLYNFNGKAIGLSGDFGLYDGSTPRYQVMAVRGNSMTLTSSIEECENGISITFETTSVEYNRTSIDSGSYFKLSFSSNPLKISKDSLQNSTKIDMGIGSYTLSANISGKNVVFSTNTNSGTLLDSDEHLSSHMVAIKSIVSY